MNASISSCLYVGQVRHRRFSPMGHTFSYRLFMTSIDLAELPELFDPYWLWSARKPALAAYSRSDYLHPATPSLDDAVRSEVASQLGFRPAGAIRLLTHLRVFGHSFNPVSIYYCYEDAGETLAAIIAQITNTPWHERHAYVLDCRGQTGNHLRFVFDKDFHVSPFMPMEMAYDWRFNRPGERLTVHMQNLAEGKKVFDATLDMKRRPLTHRNLAAALATFPMMTTKVVAAIYWQAFRLWLKNAPFHSNPTTAKADSTVS